MNSEQLGSTQIVQEGAGPSAPRWDVLRLYFADQDTRDSAWRSPNRSRRAGVYCEFGREPRDVPAAGPCAHTHANTAGLLTSTYGQAVNGPKARASRPSCCAPSYVQPPSEMRASKQPSRWLRHGRGNKWPVLNGGFSGGTCDHLDKHGISLGNRDAPRPHGPVPHQALRCSWKCVPRQSTRSRRAS